MPEVIPAKPPVAFGRRNASEDRIRQTEEELAALQAVPSDKQDNNTDEDEEHKDSAISAEEQTFKKRYGDLRRHTQKMQDDFQKQIDALKSQLESATKKEMKLPKSEEEIAAWASQFPDVYAIVETIAVKKAKEQSEGMENRLKKIDEQERRTAREKAELELLRLHPDFDVIREQDEFHTWAGEQPKWVQDALYNNDTDARAAARAIDLYKVDKGISKTKPKSSDKDAAADVSVRSQRSAPSGDPSNGMIYESQVAKMSIREYEKREEEIQKAMRSGKFVYDLSGSAR